MSNLLLMGYKPIFLSSNQYLLRLKKKYNLKKGGYLGTLDPFAKGAILMAFGQYTKLFPHIKREKKTYRATLWFGALSESLDTENIVEIKEVNVFNKKEILAIFDRLKGKITYHPPRFSAKHIHGARAYQLAREGREFVLPACQMEVFDLKLLHYEHPFLSFELCVSKGGYVRSIAQMIADALGVNATLSSLERILDAQLPARANQEIILNPLDILDYPLLEDTKGIKDQIYYGKKFALKNLQNGIYIANFEDFFSIIGIRKEGQVEYLLNRIMKC